MLYSKTLTYCFNPIGMVWPYLLVFCILGVWKYVITLKVHSCFRYWYQHSYYCFLHTRQEAHCGHLETVIILFLDNWKCLKSLWIEIHMDSNEKSYLLLTLFHTSLNIKDIACTRFYIKLKFEFNDILIYKSNNKISTIINT